MKNPVAASRMAGHNRGLWVIERCDRSATEKSKYVVAAVGKSAATKLDKRTKATVN
jgi:hypothetical protein